MANMKLIIKNKDMNDTIAYWIELEYIWRSIENLVEYTDEVGELYNETEWLADNQDGTGTSVMDVHVLLEHASDSAYEQTTLAETLVKTIVITQLELGEGEFAIYNGLELEKRVDDIIRALYDKFDAIYDYQKEKQIDNFHKKLIEILDAMKKTIDETGK